MMSYELEQGRSCDIGFTSFLKVNLLTCVACISNKMIYYTFIHTIIVITCEPFVNTTLPSSSSQVLNNVNIDQVKK